MSKLVPIDVQLAQQREENRALRAEVRRLKGALRRIAPPMEDIPHGVGFGSAYNHLHRRLLWKVEVARRVLAKRGK